MKRFIFLVMLSICAYSYAYYPVHDFYYVEGVNQGTFTFNLGILMHVYNYNSDMWLAGEDVCLMSEAAFARFANSRNGNSPRLTTVSNPITSNQFNNVISCIDAALKNDSNNGKYCWLKYDVYNTTVYPPRIDSTACGFLRDCGFQFYESYQDLSGISASENMSSGSDPISRDKARRIFGALYKQKRCVIEPSVWYLGSSYSFEKTVDDILTPSGYETSSPVEPFYSGRIAYYNRSNITAINGAETGLGCYARWMVKQEIYQPEFCNYRSRSWHGSNSCTYWNVYRAVRKKRNWDTGEVTMKTGYYLMPRTASFDKSFISELGIQDDVSCPEADSGLLIKILQSAPPAQQYRYSWDDYLIIECVTSFILSSMNGEYYWNSEWRY